MTEPQPSPDALHGWDEHLPEGQTREQVTREQLADQLDRQGIAHNLTDTEQKQ